MTPSAYEAFARALLQPDTLPQHLGQSGEGSFAQRFATYRNNVRASRTEALRQGFPTLDRLLGRDYFTALAAVFIQQHPPRSAVLHEYGAELADFIDQFQPLSSFGYLGDIARLEWARLRAFHADDTPVLRIAEMDLASLSKRLEQPLQWHPSVTLLESAHPLYRLWASQQGTASAPSAQCWSAETVLIWRQGLVLRAERVDEVSGHLLRLAVEPPKLSVALGQSPQWLGRLLQLLHWQVFAA
ncbi:putative DNA-binding domain-containing protein [Pseudomonas sp. zbq_18]|uniref:HvfC/BufC family peptide modification chaperone n=1 Tax=Pseudomonadota TaxID=1224 RepID=UPI00370A5CFB